MTIQKHEGNMLLVSSGILVHGCNCLGAMGSGIAGFIRDKWPDVYQGYKEHEKKYGLHLGDVNFVGSTSFRGTPLESHLHKITDQLPAGVIVANAMTQQIYGSDKDVVYVDYPAINKVMARVVELCRLQTGLEPHFPLIGCGLANGKWEEVGSRIEQELGDMTGHLWLLPPAKPAPAPQPTLF